MKKLFSKALVLLLAFSLFFCGTGIFAATVTFVAEGKEGLTLNSTDGKVTMPASDSFEIKEGTFVGWYGTLNGNKFLLPPGAVLEGVSESLTVTAATLKFTADKVATLRVDGDDLGVRFTSTIDTSDYERLVTYAGEDGVRMGTYIVPSYYLQNSGKKFDVARFMEYGYTKVLDIPTSTFYSVDKKAGTSTIAGSVCKVLDKNLTRDYCGCGYMEITYTNGESKLFYAEFNHIETIYSLTSVIFKAYEDRDGRYAYLIKKGTHGRDATHSNYTMAELDVMKKYLDSIVSINCDNVDPHFEYYTKKCVYYTSPWVVDEIPNTPKSRCNTVVVTPSEGHTISELKAVAFKGRYQSMTYSDGYSTAFVNGTFRFVHNEVRTVNP